MTRSVTLYGADYSVYTRIARLALEEKGVAYDFEPVDIFAQGATIEEYLLRHPFSKIPAFEYDDFPLYEAGAISRYVDEAFGGPALQPDAPQARARMNQVISILDSYGYKALVWDVFFERVRVPQKGGAPDESKIAAGLDMSRKCLLALGDIKGRAKWLAGDVFSLADCHAYPMFVLFRMAKEGDDLFADAGGLGQWYKAFHARKSAQATRHPLETEESV